MTRKEFSSLSKGDKVIQRKDSHLGGWFDKPRRVTIKGINKKERKAYIFCRSFCGNLHFHVTPQDISLE